MTNPNLTEQPYPRFIKYMGSKSKIMDFVLEGINEVHQGGPILDLFSGSASLAGAIGQQSAVHSNDIQAYAGVIARTYSTAYCKRGIPSPEALVDKADAIYSRNRKALGRAVDFGKVNSIDDFSAIEAEQRNLINRQFKRDWHLFVKYYSGTWWSLEQCLWIDAFREVAEEYVSEPYYPAILASLMFAMAYTSQGTGHYAQYRDAKTESSLKDILIYRRRSLPQYFLRKFEEVSNWMPASRPSLHHQITALDYRECLSEFSGGTVYADPPYCFVHYSRFYHALETLVLYDYPELQVKGGSIVKGRYREGRHQSPFCISTQVHSAFEEMFKGVSRSCSSLAMSYSNTGMISIDDIEKLALSVFKGKTVQLFFTDHQHMTLGRRQDRHREVQECLLLVKN